MSTTKPQATLVVGPGNRWPQDTRNLRFLSVDSMPLNTYTFRIELIKDGHDDSSGRDFDWWFDRLQKAAEQFREEGGPPPVVKFTERSYVNGIYHDTTWKGLLGNDGTSSSPRICTANGDLFEFDLKVATVTRTTTVEEHLPDEVRWADMK